MTSWKDRGIAPMGPEVAEESIEPWWLPYRRHWKLLTVICGGFVVAALLLSALRTPIYQAEARLAVGSGQMTALNIPGYPTAAEQMASNYARWVRHGGTQGTDAPPGTLSLTASPIVESNVLRIEATSYNPETALQAAAQAAEQLMETVNTVRIENDPAELITSIQETVEPLERARELAESRSRAYRQAAADSPSSPETQGLFDEYIAAEQDLVRLELLQDGMRDRYRNLTATRSTEADLVDVQPAEVVGSDRMEVAQRNLLLALVAGLVLGAGSVQIQERRSRREGRARRAASQADVAARG